MPAEFMDDQMSISNGSVKRLNEENSQSPSKSRKSKGSSGKSIVPSLNPSHESISAPKFGSLPLFGKEMKINVLIKKPTFGK
jgi:hypothetical protein